MKIIATTVLALVSLTLAAGPRISILGDSYSTYEGVIPPGNAIWYLKAPRNANDVTKAEECWWAQVVKNLGGTLERNESWSGSTICNTGYGGRDFTSFSFVSRVGRLGDPELILICGATNDSWANSPIGEYKYSDWTAQDLKTFRPAMAEMLADLRRLYPTARIYFILNDCLKPEINDSVHTICTHYSVPCIDLVSIAKQTGHPSIAGMKSIADQVTAAVRK